MTNPLLDALLRAALEYHEAKRDYRTGENALPGEAVLYAGARLRLAADAWAAGASLLDVARHGPLVELGRDFERGLDAAIGKPPRSKAPPR